MAINSQRTLVHAITIKVNFENSCKGLSISVMSKNSCLDIQYATSNKDFVTTPQLYLFQLFFFFLEMLVHITMGMYNAHRTYTEHANCLSHRNTTLAVAEALLHDVALDETAQTGVVTRPKPNSFRQCKQCRIQ